MEGYYSEDQSLLRFAGTSCGASSAAVLSSTSTAQMVRIAKTIFSSAAPSFYNPILTFPSVSVTSPLGSFHTVLFRALPFSATGTPVPPFLLKGGLCFRSRKHYPENPTIQGAVPFSPGQQAIFVKAQIRPGVAFA